jgi:hypothetical protein
MKLNREELRKLVTQEIVSSYEKSKNIREDKFLTSGKISLLAASDEETINEVIAFAMKHGGKIGLGSTLGSVVASELGPCVYQDLGTTAEHVEAVFEALSEAMAKALITDHQSTPGNLPGGAFEPLAPGPPCSSSLVETCEKWGINCGNIDEQAPPSYLPDLPAGSKYPGTCCENILDWYGEGYENESLCDYEDDDRFTNFDGECDDECHAAAADWYDSTRPEVIEGVAYDKDSAMWHTLPGWQWSEDGLASQFRIPEEDSYGRQQDYAPVDTFGYSNYCIAGPESDDVQKSIMSLDPENPYGITECTNTKNPDQLARMLYEIERGQFKETHYNILLNYPQVFKAVFREKGVIPPSSADYEQQNAIDLVAMLTWDPRPPDEDILRPMWLQELREYDTKVANHENYHRAVEYVEACPYTHMCCGDNMGPATAPSVEEYCYDSWEDLEEDCWMGGEDGGIMDDSLTGAYYDGDDDCHEETGGEPGYFLSFNTRISGRRGVEHTSLPGLVEEPVTHGPNDMCIQLIKAGLPAEPVGERPEKTLSRFAALPSWVGPKSRNLSRQVGAYSGFTDQSPDSTGEWAAQTGVTALYMIWNTVGLGADCSFARATLPGSGGYMGGDTDPQWTIDNYNMELGTWKDYIDLELDTVEGPHTEDDTVSDWIPVVGRTTTHER